MNTPAQCGAIKPPKTDIYSEAPQIDAARAKKNLGLDAQDRCCDHHHVIEPEVIHGS